MLYDDPGEGGCSEGREAQEGEDMCKRLIQVVVWQKPT